MDEAPPTDRTGNVRGDLIGGAYVVDRALGEGSTGVVVAARRRVDGARLAVKVGRTPDPEARARFQLAARAMQRLKSPNSVRVFDVGVTDAGAPWMAMELLEGRDLETVLADRKQLELEDVIRWILQACRALAEAHESGLIHRDVKPQNLFLARRAPSGETDGRPEAVAVLDYGFSTPLAALDSVATRLAKPGGIVGTSHYMAPEQVRGLPADARSDVWAVGACFFRLLTNMYPFAGETLSEVCRGILEMPVPDIGTLRPDVPRSAEVAILRCLRKDPGDRFASMRDLLRALHDARAELRATPIGLAIVPSVVSSSMPMERTLIIGSGAPSSIEPDEPTPHIPIPSPLGRPRPAPPPPPPSSEDEITRVAAVMLPLPPPTPTPMPVAKPPPVPKPPPPPIPEPEDPLAAFGSVLAARISESGLTETVPPPPVGELRFPDASPPRRARPAERPEIPVAPPAPPKPPKRRRRKLLVFFFLVLVAVGITGFLRFSGRLPQIPIPWNLDR